MMAATTLFYMKIRNGSTPIPLPDVVKNGDPITAKWANGIRLALQRLRDRTPVVTGNGKINGKIKPPLWITLQQVAGASITWQVYAEYGHVVPRHNKSTDTGEPITISGLPTQSAPLAVIENTKLWVKLTINDEGRVTTAEFESGTSWDEDTPPELKGGDNTSGATGYRYIQIAEIIADPDSIATPPNLVSSQLLTGHIDHFQNELVENIDTTGSNVLKEWDATTAKWMLRTITAGENITVTENADNIEVGQTPDSGWSGTVSFVFIDNVGSLSNDIVLTFANGILTELFKDGVQITGTAAAPGAEVFTCQDTDT